MPGDGCGGFAPAGFGVPVAPVDNVLKELVGLISALRDELLAFEGSLDDEQPFVFFGVEQFVQRVFDGGPTDAQSQMGAGDVLDRMGFVQNDRLVVGEDVDSFLPQGQIGEEECMVDDQDIGVVESFAGSEVEAVVVGRAFSSQAIPGFALEQWRLQQLDDFVYWVESRTGCPTGGCGIVSVRSAVERNGNLRLRWQAWRWS